MAKTRKHLRHGRRRGHGNAVAAAGVAAQRRPDTKQLAQTKLRDDQLKSRQQIKDAGHAGWSMRAAGWILPAAALAIAVLLVTVAGLAIERARLHTQLDRADVGKRAAEVAATDARNARLTALKERDLALEAVRRLEQQTKELTTQIASSRETIDRQREIIDNPAKILETQNEELLEVARDGTKITPGEEVKDGKGATVTGEVVLPDQRPARFVSIDAWRADARVAAAISDKNGRFRMQIPRDDVVLKFMAPGRVTSDITLNGKHQYQLKVLLVDRKGERVRR
jgi:hypothetical protein